MGHGAFASSAVKSLFKTNPRLWCGVCLGWCGPRGRPMPFIHSINWPKKSPGVFRRAGHRGRFPPPTIASLGALSEMTTTQMAAASRLPARGAVAIDPVFLQIRDLVYKVCGIFQLEEKLY